MKKINFNKVYRSKLETCPDGMTLPTPKAIDFNPGDLHGCL